MAIRRPSLTGAFDSPEPPAAQPIERPEPGLALAAKPESSRAGMVSMPFWVDPAVRKALRQMALDEDTTAQALLLEAVDLLFAQRGKPRLAVPVHAPKANQ
jgi:hypothetical protein